MMNNTTFWKIWAINILMLPAILFSACQQDDEKMTSEADEAEFIVTDEAITDDLFEDIDLVSDEAAAYDEANEGGRITTDDQIVAGECVSRAIDRLWEDGVYTKIVTLGFQEECTGPNGRERQGTMIITRVANNNTATYTVSTTFEDFYLDGKKIEGTRTRVYTSPESGVHQVAITLTGGKVTLEDGRVIQREGTFTKTWNRKEGEISVIGASSGVNRYSVAYETNITEPLVYKYSCMAGGVFMAVKGIRTISRTNKADAVITYGTGECDKTVEMTLNGESRTLEITLTKE